MRLQPPVDPPRPHSEEPGALQQDSLVDHPADYVHDQVVFVPLVPVFFLGNPEDLDPPDGVLDAYADPRVRLVVFPLVGGEILARLARHGDPRVYSLDHLVHPTVRGVPVVSKIVAAGLVRYIPVPAGESGRERGVLHLVHLEVVVAAGGVGRLVDDQPVEAGRVLDLDSVRLGLA